MTTKKPADDETYTPPPYLGGDTPPDADKPKTDKKEKSKYTEDVNDPAYVEPRLREGWTPDQPG